MERLTLLGLIMSKPRTEGELKDAVDAVIANRNKIAHGGDVGITYATIRSYYRNAVSTIEIIEEQLQPL